MHRSRSGLWKSPQSGMGIGWEPGKHGHYSGRRPNRKRIGGDTRTGSAIIKITPPRQPQAGWVRNAIRPAHQRGLSRSERADPGRGSRNPRAGGRHKGRLRQSLQQRKKAWLRRPATPKTACDGLELIKLQPLNTRHAGGDPRRSEVWSPEPSRGKCAYWVHRAAISPKMEAAEPPL